MSKELIRPIWYDEEFYNKTLTPEEWLFELCKRYKFSQDEIGLPYSIYTLPINEQAYYFRQFIFNKQIEKFLNRNLEAVPPQPIKDLSISDIFIMYHSLIKTEWYKNKPNREVFESAISAIINEKALSKTQEQVFSEMYKIPWCGFYDKHQQDSWCPKREIEHLTGIPLSLDPGYAKTDTVKILKKKLNSWVGKLQSIEFQFDSWQERKILAVFDLRFWFTIHGLEFTNIGIHKLIWPQERVTNSRPEGVSPDDDIRHSIKMVSGVINKSVIGSLFLMCEARKYKEGVII